MKLLVSIATFAILIVVSIWIKETIAYFSLREMQFCFQLSYSMATIDLEGRNRQSYYDSLGCESYAVMVVCKDVNTTEMNGDRAQMQEHQETLATDPSKL